MMVKIIIQLVLTIHNPVDFIKNYVRICLCTHWNILSYKTTRDTYQNIHQFQLPIEKSMEHNKSVNFQPCIRIG